MNDIPQNWLYDNFLRGWKLKPPSGEYMESMEKGMGKLGKLCRKSRNLQVSTGSTQQKQWCLAWHSCRGPRQQVDEWKSGHGMVMEHSAFGILWQLLLGLVTLWKSMEITFFWAKWSKMIEVNEPIFHSNVRLLGSIPWMSNDICSLGGLNLNLSWKTTCSYFVDQQGSQFPCIFWGTKLHDRMRKGHGLRLQHASASKHWSIQQSYSISIIVL